MSPPHEYVLILKKSDTGFLRDEFSFADALHLLPSSWLPGILRKRNESDRINTLCDRLMMIYGCSYLTGIHPEFLSFDKGVYGKPFLKRPKERVTFSMSYGDDYLVMYVITLPDSGAPQNIQSEVGIDIASVNDCDGDLAAFETVFTRREYDILKFAPNKPAMFAYLWSLKESYSKFTGTGLLANLKEIDLGPNVLCDSLVRKINGKKLLFRSTWLNSREVITTCRDLTLHNGDLIIQNLDMHGILNYFKDLNNN